VASAVSIFIVIPENKILFPSWRD